jgi:hypothetical protein
MKLKLVLVTCVFSWQALAQLGLSRPSAFENAGMLPDGVRNLRYRYISMPTYDKYDATHNTVPLGNALNKNVSFEDLASGKETKTEQNEARALMKNEGVEKLSQIAGRTTGTVSAQVNAHVPVFAYGVNEKWTLGLAVPVIESQVRIETGSVANASFQKFANSLKASKADKYDTAKRDFARAIAKKLEDKGYKPLEDSDSSDIGDIRFVSKYALSRNSESTFALLTGVTLPTGREKDIDKAVDVPTGDGQYDLDLGFLYDYRFYDGWVSSVVAAYTWQVQDRLETRIPEEADSLISADKDLVRRDLGDIFRSQLMLRYDFEVGYFLGSGYLFQYKNKDSYEGQAYSQQRYGWLEKNTQQTMHSAEVAMGWSTINLYRAGKFVAPAEVSLTHSVQFAGKNIAKDAITAFEMALFF